MNPTTTDPQNGTEALGAADARARREIHLRLAHHERSLWLTTIAIVVMSAATLAILTAASAMAGAFRGTYSGYALAGACFLVLGVFIAYVAVQRETLERNRARIYRELESRQTRYAEANRALQEALRTRDIFLDTVSHELKTPLTCVIAYADYLAQEDLDPEEVRGHARTIHGEAQQLLRLIDQVVDVTRFRSGTLALDRQPVDLNRVLDRALERTRPEAALRGMELLADLAATPLIVEVDRARMEAAVESLVRHILSGAAPEAVVRVQSREADEGWVQVRIEDRRPQAPPEEREAAFRLFEGLDPEPQGRSGDLGLSLPLVKRYVLAHGGVLDTEELQPQGLAFQILLPLAEASPLQEAV